ncbi:MAG: septal ring lytic transglycosylase RlpA family protein [Candidatus Hydrogenedentota bacterium]
MTYENASEEGVAPNNPKHYIMKEYEPMLEIALLMVFSQHALQPVEIGLASYYTVNSSGAVTASGERLRDDAFTAAMVDGEFGHYYLVQAENGNSVVVRLNDRGPYVDGRVIDLSKAAMRELSPTAGLVDVKVYHLGPRIPPNLRGRN